MYDPYLPEVNTKEYRDSRMKEENVVIDISLVRRLIASQFPQWRELSIDPVGKRLTNPSCSLGLIAI